MCFETYTKGRNHPDRKKIPRSITVIPPMAPLVEFASTRFVPGPNTGVNMDKGQEASVGKGGVRSHRMEASL